MPVLEPKQKPAKSPLKHQFSQETARLNALKGVEARKRYALERAKAQTQAEQIPAQPTLSPTLEPDRAKGFAYLEKQLTRVRKQLDRLFSMLADEIDPAKIDRLASAIARLSEIERQLADRPLPGSKRPAQDKPQQSRASILLGGAAEPSSGRIEQE